MMIAGAGREFIIKDTHRGLYYEDGNGQLILDFANRTERHIEESKKICLRVPSTAFNDIRCN